MRIPLAFVLVFGCVTLASGQDGVRKVIFKSDSQQRMGNVIQARGHVKIYHGTALITADEADITDGGPNGPVDMQLRGAVHLHVNIAE